MKTVEVAQIQSNVGRNRAVEACKAIDRSRFGHLMIEVGFSCLPALHHCNHLSQPD